MTEMSEAEENFVRQYIEGQLRDEGKSVTLVQKLGTRRNLGRTYKLYDVWMNDDERFWLITEPLNYYVQADFNSVDIAFTYHLGLGMVLADQSRRVAESSTGDDFGTGSPSWRKYERAVNAMNQAEEAEDFQAVGIRCRESLLALVRQHHDAAWINDAADGPKMGDFNGWIELHAAALSSSRPRRYLTSLGKKTWDLTVWLQHYSDATDWDAELVLDATSHFLAVFGLVVAGFERGAPRQCPSCQSYRIEGDSKVIKRDGVEGYWTQEACAACDWRGPDSFESWDSLARASSDPDS